MRKFAKNSIPTVCIVASLLITYWSVNVGMDRSLAGKPALIWLHVIAFIAAVGLVLAAIILKTKSRP